MDFWPKVIFDYQRQAKITLRKSLILWVFAKGGVERGVRSGYNKRRLADIQENIGKQKEKNKIQVCSVELLQLLRSFFKYCCCGFWFLLFLQLGTVKC